MKIKFNAIWQLAWPVMLSNITIPLLGMIDIAVVGHDYPAHVLGAVAIGSMVFDVLFFAFGFLRMSTTGLVAQNPTDLNILYRALFTAGIIALILIASQDGLFYLICWLMEPGLAVQHALHDYFYLRIYASPATLGNFVILGYFFGRQNTKIPLLILMLVNLSAISLDFVFVSYLGWGVKGLALANLCAQILGFVLGLNLIYGQYIKQTPRALELFDLTAFKRLFHLNKDIFIRTLCLMTTLTYFTSAGSRLGTSVVAANAILLSMQQFMACGLDGFAIACEVMVGRAIGANNLKDFIASVKACGYLSLLIALLFSVVYMLLGKYIILGMTSLPHVSATAQAYLLWMVALPVLSVGGFLLDGVFIGATWSKPMRNTMLCATGLVYFPSVFFSKHLGNTGLWMAFALFMLSRGLFLAVALRRRLLDWDL
ncbi:MAG: MATE family efflux transporter [Legionellaceae bacterium]|nr:MATE family efflux transporter [Legionellaceae bacterium]